MDLLNMIKKAAVDAVKAEQPCSVLFGKVVSDNPLQININQKLTLASDFLVLTKAVQDYEVDIEVSYEVEEDTFKESHTHTFSGTDSSGDSFIGTTGSGNLKGKHKHKVKGKKKIKVCNGLKAGEEVIVIKAQGGQKYVVLDRLTAHNTRWTMDLKGVIKMLPNTSKDLISDFEYEKMPSYTYCLDIGKNGIKGKCDGMAAIKQAIYKILNTERYESEIYSWNYGVELKGLFGKPISYVIPELKRRIKEALIQDDRIDEVDSFEFQQKKEKILIQFTVHTSIGEIGYEWEVPINV